MPFLVLSLLKRMRGEWRCKPCLYMEWDVLPPVWTKSMVSKFAPLNLQKREVQGGRSSLGGSIRISM